VIFFNKAVKVLQKGAQPLEDVLQQLGTWMKVILVNGIMTQLTGLFDSVK